MFPNVFDTINSDVNRGIGLLYPVKNVFVSENIFLKSYRDVHFLVSCVYWEYCFFLALD